MRSWRRRPAQLPSTIAAAASPSTSSVGISRPRSTNVEKSLLAASACQSARPSSETALRTASLL